MAKKRMMSMQIIDSDAFLDMPVSAQALYLHLLARADDEGFLNNYKKIMRIIRAADDDLKILMAKNFILLFESGVILIKHWLIHNKIRKERLIPTVHTEEKLLITTKENGTYTYKDNNVRQMSDTCQTNGSIGEVRLGEISLGKVSLVEESIEDEKPTRTPKHKYGEYSHVLLTEEQHSKLTTDYTNTEALIKFLDEYIEMKGYKAKNHYLAIKKWVVDAVKEREQKQPKKEYSTVSEELDARVKRAREYMEVN